MVGCFILQMIRVMTRFFNTRFSLPQSVPHLVDRSIRHFHRTTQNVWMCTFVENLHENIIGMTFIVLKISICGHEYNFSEVLG